MGEESKKSGEIGEAIASALLSMIGWKTFMQNVSIDCNTASHVNEKGNSRTTHGEDQIFLYHSPFHDDRTDIVHVSNKNNIVKYAKAGTLKSQFKEHFKELHQTIDCAKYSPALNRICTSFGVKKTKYHSGLLIWLHNDKDDIEHNIISELANTRLDIESDDPVYIIDNARATFLMKVIDDLKRRSENENFEFYYPRIGSALSVDAGRSGKILPLELIAADIIPAVIRENSGLELVLYANQSFDESTYEKLVAYGLNFGTGLVTTINIGMPDYNPAQDQHITTQVRMSFHERSEIVVPFSFNRSILDLLPEKKT